MVILAGWITIGVHSDKVLGIDFRGGTELVFSFDPGQKDALKIDQFDLFSKEYDLGILIPIFEQPVDSPERLRLQIDSQKGRKDQVIQALKQNFKTVNLVELSSNQIGPSVSRGILKDATNSIILALLAIFLYVAFRFEWGFGVGAIAAILHDALISIGLYVILGQIFFIGAGQFSSPMLAAVLMILGYSINDTIVVFDRIREELKLRPKINLFDSVNLAINQTLGRTLLTSLTTFLAGLSLFIFGAGIVRDFALIFMIGIFAGTFSSIFIATPIFYWWYKGDRQKVMNLDQQKSD